jgi:hypothetical protein
MAFEQLTERLNEIAKKLDEAVPEVALVQSFTELQADFLQRVFVDGTASDGSKIGDYSTKPEYFTKNQFVKTAAFKAQGKNGDTKFKTVTRPRTSMYLKGGYKEFRDVQGRPTNTVNLDLSGSLKRAYRVFKFGDSVLFGQNDTEEHKKIEGLTDRFGEWQSLTQEEIDNLKATIPEQIAIILGNDNQTTT